MDGEDVCRRHAENFLKPRPLRNPPGSAPVIMVVYDCTSCIVEDIDGVHHIWTHPDNTDVCDL